MLVSFQENTVYLIPVVEGVHMVMYLSLLCLPLAHKQTLSRLLTSLGCCVSAGSAPLFCSTAAQGWGHVM